MLDALVFSVVAVPPVVFLLACYAVGRRVQGLPPVRSRRGGRGLWLLLFRRL